jgi:hypothetical protein
VDVLHPDSAWKGNPLPHARNRVDGCRVYFEDEGGVGVAVVIHGGFLDSVVDARESTIAQALPADEFRRIYVVSSRDEAAHPV